MRILVLALTLISLVASSVGAAADKDTVVKWIDEQRSEYGGIAQQIWDLSEVGYQEFESADLLKGQLREAGFEVRGGVAGIPTAFEARFGQGGPTIAILAEFDALPGITQERKPERVPRDGASAGHACGHHLFGAGSVLAAVAVKKWLQESGVEGTIRLYGTPAEEGGAGKVYMVRAGLFEDVDAVLHWHAGDRNDASPGASLANRSAKFRFRGISAHAAGAPWRGRSALDGVEAFNHMVNLMREHVPPETRIHYVITAGGSAPNVIPDFSEVFYYVRHPDPSMVRKLFDRVVQAAEGAARGTGTEMDYEVIHGILALLPNETLQKVMHENLQGVGGVKYSPEEREFAQKIRETFGENAPPLERAAQIAPYEIKPPGGSTDVGDVSWVVPTAGLRTATWVPGTAAHSWQAIAAGGMSIGEKGMINAAKTLALTAIDLMLDPQIVQEAAEERMRRIGPNFQYEPLLGDRDPPLDYRRPPRQ